MHALAFESVLMKWMHLEPIIQSEINQKEKTKYPTLTHIYEIQKDGPNEPICRAAMEKQTQKTDLWTWGSGDREGGMNGESSKAMCTPPYEKQIASGNLLFGSGSSNKGW